MSAELAHDNDKAQMSSNMGQCGRLKTLFCTRNIDLADEVVSK